MIHQQQPRIDPSEQATLAELDHRLRAEGWAYHVTVGWMLAKWHALSLSVDGYDLSIDDYTNDLAARDGLAWTLKECQQPLRDKLAAWIEVADRVFIAGTQDDADGALGRFFPVEEDSGWWWRRRPTNGPLADALTHR